jgi:hypothetical protein
LLAASASAECDVEYVHVVKTIPHIPCISVEVGCEKNVTYFSNYCSADAAFGSGMEGNLALPTGTRRQQVFLGGLDPSSCIESCIFFNESLEWQKNESCAADCVDNARRYSLNMSVGGVDFTLSGEIFEHRTYVSPTARRMLLLLHYILPAAIVLFLLVQWLVYKTDKFVFDDYGMRNLIVITLTAVAYVILSYMVGGNLV